MKIGWLVNDTLTKIPNTKTFWHFLLENINNLENKTKGKFNNLEKVIEYEYKKSKIKPKYIIRNGSFFLPININIYTIIIIQDNYISKKKQFDIQIKNIKKANLIIFNSIYVYKKYEKFIKKKPYKIIPIPTNFNLFKPIDINSNFKLNFKILDNSIIYIGSSKKYPKGFNRVLNIIENMNEQNFCLILKDNYTIKHLPKNIQNRVIILNNINQKLLSQIINQCILGICTSYEETLHLAGIEVLACNKPMVSTNVGFYYDNNNSTEWGLIANDDNFIDKINYVKNNLNEFNPRNFLKNKGYSIEECKDNWINTVKSL